MPRSLLFPKVWGGEWRKRQYTRQRNMLCYRLLELR